MSRRIVIDTVEASHSFPLAPENAFGLAITRSVTEAALDGYHRMGWHGAPHPTALPGFTIRSWVVWR